MKKRLLSALLAVAMMFSLFPASAFASADQTRGGVDVSTPQTLDTENDPADVIEIVFNPNGPVLNNSYNPKGGLDWDDMGIDPTDYMTTDDRGTPTLSYTATDSAGNKLWTYYYSYPYEYLYLISGRFELVNRPRPAYLLSIVVGSYSDPHPAAELMGADLDFTDITLTVTEGCKISGGHYENRHHSIHDGFEIVNYGEISGGTFKNSRVDFHSRPGLTTVISGGEFSNTTPQSFAYHATKITGGTFHHCLVEFDESIEASAGHLPVFDDARIDFCGTAERGAVVKGGLFRGCYFRPSDYGNSVIENGFFLSASGEVYTTNKLQAITGGLFFNSRINDRYLEEPSNSPYYYVTIEGDVKNRHSYLSVISAKDEYGNPCDPGRYTTYPDIYQYYSGAATAPSIKLATRDFRDAYKNGEPLEIFGNQFTFNDSTAADNITIDADVLLKRIPLLTLPEKVENVTGSDMNGTALRAGASAYVRQRHEVSFTQDSSHPDAVYTANDTPLTPAADGVYSYTMAGPDDVVVKQLNKLAIKPDGKPDTDGTFKETGTDGVTTTWYGDGWHYDGTTLTITANQDLSGAKVSVPTEVTDGTTRNGLFEHGLTLNGGNATESVVFESFTDNTGAAHPKILHVPAGATINEAVCASGTAYILGDPALTVGQPAGTPVGSLWKAEGSDGAAVSERDLSLPEGSFGNAELAFKMGERSELTLTLTQPPVRSLSVPENCTVYINGIAQTPADSYLVHPGETVKVVNPDPTGGPYAWSSEEVTLTPSADTSSCSFVVPAGEGNITIAVTTAPDSPPTPDVTDDAGASVGGSIAVSVLLGGAAYLVGTNIWLTELYGTVPQNRIQLALALWNRADCPAPESTVLYPDIDEDDADAQAAARWCVEQGLLKDYRKTDADGTETAVFKPYLYTFRAKSIKAWYDLDRLLHETQ